MDVRISLATACAALLGVQLLAQPPQYPQLPSETPRTFTPVTAAFDHVRRDVMIPMRDGVKLHTVILVPKSALGGRSAPILLTRTPYNATELTSHNQSAHLSMALDGYDNAVDVIVDGGYIRVVQDIRGKYGSEGDYVMNRPLRGPLNPTPVDHATDTYDTIDWLVKNVPETNGKVGILGISYDGFLPLMALVNPHPALKVSVPMNPMVDGWMGDDWFHNGAFRQQGMSLHLRAGGDASERREVVVEPFRRLRHVHDGGVGRRARTPLRDGTDRVLAEDLGAPGVRRVVARSGGGPDSRRPAAERAGHAGAQPLGSGRHLRGHCRLQGDRTEGHGERQGVPRDRPVASRPGNPGRKHAGPLKFGSDTALYFRQEILRPFLDHYLKDGAPKADVAPVTAFETGTNVWRRLSGMAGRLLDRLPHRADAALPRPGLKATLTAPAPGGAGYEEYVSDPAKPVPFIPRPVRASGTTWAQWLVSDQREASGRPDVLAFASDVLTAPVKISGQPIVNLTASTSGTDADWVVKVIDVYPDQVAGQPAMGGYQLMVSADIFRGRYRESVETAKAIAADTPLLYKWSLPTANHVFLPGIG